MQIKKPLAFSFYTASKPVALGLYTMIEAACWDLQLYHNYQAFGGLYGSYPAHKQFETSISAFERFAAMRESSKQQRDLNVQVNFPSAPDNTAEAADYIQALQQEISLLSRFVRTQKTIQQLCFTGHTSAFSTEQLTGTMQYLHEQLPIESHILSNYSIDIDPCRMSWSDMGALRDAGFNRCNFHLSGHELNFRQLETIYEAARTLQYCSVSVSVSYGLPRQSKESFAARLDKIISLTPERISLHKHPETACIRLLPQLLQLAIKKLGEAGYGYVGMDCFALPDDDLIAAQEAGLLSCNNESIPSRACCDLLGFGAEAVCQIGSLSYQNSTSTLAYINNLKSGQLPPAKGKHCTIDDMLRRYIIHSLSSLEKISFNDLEQRFGISFNHYFADVLPHLQDMQKNGLLQLDRYQLQMTVHGHLLTNAVCRLFDRCHVPTLIDEQLYTRTC